MLPVIALVPETTPLEGPDLTRYLAVCAGLIGGLLLLAWLFRRHVAGHLRARAGRRSLQVLDVLPLSGKQKLVVVRCYDRSFLLGLGEKEVRAIAELDGAAPPRAANSALSEPNVEVSADFAHTLDHELVAQPPLPRKSTPGPKGGVLA